MYLSKLFYMIFSLVCTITIAAKSDQYNSDYNNATQISGMKLVWQDEFNNDGKPNPENWTFENGFVRNKELQWYQENNAVCKDGLLVITAKREKVKNPNYDPKSSDWKKNRKYAEYTSSSIRTDNLQNWKFGRFLIRARINTKKGNWPAIWTLGINNPWPSCGEIDIMELHNIYNAPTLLANFAWGTSQPWVAKWDSKKIKLKKFIKSDPDWVKKFHIWRLDWNENKMKIYLDDKFLNDVSLRKTINADGSNPFLQPHSLLLSLAIGGAGGDPSQTTFPLTFEVDYARVYQDSTNIESAIESIKPIVPFKIKHFPNRNSIEISMTKKKTVTKTLPFCLYSLNGRIIYKSISTYNNLTNSYIFNLNGSVKSGTYILGFNQVFRKNFIVVIR